MPPENDVEGPEDLLGMILVRPSLIVSRRAIGMGAQKVKGDGVDGGGGLGLSSGLDSTQQDKT
jgi:hypothetical protein